MSGAIAYDGTAPPAPDLVRRWAAALGLPDLRWTVTRQLLGRIVAVGTAPSGAERWVLRAGSGDDPARSFQRALAGARLLESAARRAGSDWLAPPDVAAWRHAALEGTDVLASPWIDGTPLAPERRLDAPDAADLAAHVGRAARVAAELAALTPHVPAGSLDRRAYVDGRLQRAEERLAALVAGDGLDRGEAVALAGELGRRMERVSMPTAFAHGELTPWHLLRRPDGRISLLDLETVGADGPAYVDDTVFAMRTWALNASPSAARAYLVARLELEPAATRGRIDAELAWQWLYAAVRTRSESLAWPDRSGAESFWAWATHPDRLVAARV